MTFEGSVLKKAEVKLEHALCENSYSQPLVFPSPGISPPFQCYQNSKKNLQSDKSCQSTPHPNSLAWHCLTPYLFQCILARLTFTPGFKTAWMRNQPNENISSLTEIGLKWYAGPALRMRVNHNSFCTVLCIISFTFHRELVIGSR